MNKKILITGANSYIGTSFERYLKQWPDKYQVDTLDMTDIGWKNVSFNGYSSVFHVAGIAHRKEKKENISLYYEINRDLAIETAKKAKEDGVSQFIFLSSMSVYGMETGVITKWTVPLPKSNYGKSKLQAEKKINELANNDFKVCILRPPMVYGKNCKGNFQTLLKISNIAPIVPKLKNERSMIYIDNLNSFVKLCIDEKLDGIYFPQNKEYVSTIAMMNVIADAYNKKHYNSTICGFLIDILKPYITILAKAFGTLKYEELEEFSYKYCVIEFEESVRKSI